MVGGKNERVRTFTNAIQHPGKLRGAGGYNGKKRKEKGGSGDGAMSSLETNKKKAME